MKIDRFVFGASAAIDNDAAAAAVASLFLHSVHLPMAFAARVQHQLTHTTDQRIVA